MKIKVEYTVRYTCDLEVDETTWINNPVEYYLPDLYADQISDIDIPEGGLHNSVYVEKSFKVKKVSLVPTTVLKEDVSPDGYIQLGLFDNDN